MSISRITVATMLGSFLAACGSSDESAVGTTSQELVDTKLASRMAPKRPSGAVFTMSDDAVSNTVLSFERAPNGMLAPVGTYPTGGVGSGHGEGLLGSQGAVSSSSDGRFLFVVNAGSNDVSSFRAEGAKLTLAGRASSGGMLPVSITENHGIVYVVNAGGAGNISGLVVDHDGGLHPIPGSSRPLSGESVGPADIEFDKSGRTLAVTEKKSQMITLYDVGPHGFVSGPHPFPSAGATPFGFEFTGSGFLVASEAAGGAALGSSVSSYRLRHRTLEVVSPAVADLQTAACWLTVTKPGDYAFVANAASGSISTYHVGGRGILDLVASVAGSVPSGKPLDVALSSTDQFLYALDGGNHAIHGFEVGGSAALTSLGPVASGLPATVVGLAAR